MTAPTIDHPVDLTVEPTGSAPVATPLAPTADAVAVMRPPPSPPRTIPRWKSWFVGSGPPKKWPEVPPRLRWAYIVTAVYHGGLLLFGTYRTTYDAYVHLFLADHYARDWFSTWDTRWYTGFTTVSYPPGTHQAMGALSKLVGLDTAFAFIQLFILFLLATGMYRFGLCWVNQKAAATGALLLICSSTVAQTVHLYGQLPTTFAAAFLLNAIPFIRKWVTHGRPIDLVCGIITLAACTAGHHVTTLFGSVFFLGPVLVHAILERSRIPRSDETLIGEPPINRATLVPLMLRRFRRLAPAALRAGILGPGILMALLGVVLPYWISSATDPINQVSIPHGSRANFLADKNLGLMFFVIPWGLNFFLIPYALVRATLDKKWPLAASIFTLFVLGTGGTTPISEAVLGHAFWILTLDRFTTWAAIQIMPLAGMFVLSLEDGSVANWLRRTGGRYMLRITQTFLIVLMLGFTLFSATLSQYRKFQPQTIDPDPIVAFLEKDNHDRWRFLTLGFGDQVAWLSAQTLATQVDGNYHSARRLPELTSTSVERLEGAKYRGISGLGSLQQFIEVPEKYNLKYIFSNDAFYDPLLHFAGWKSLGLLENGIEVWERADIPPLPAELPSREVAMWQRIMWGVIPPSAMVTALIVLTWTFFGRPGTRKDEEVDMERQQTRVVVGPLKALDQVLRKSEETLEALPPEQLQPKAVSLSQRAMGVIRGFANRKVKRRTKIIRVSIILVILLWWPVRVFTTDGYVASPERTAEGYYDDLDFRRFESAYDRLDPRTRPDYELWRLQLSVNGGLLASYAKLDRLEVEVIEQTDDGRATVRADLTFITAIDWYPIVEEMELIERDGEWYVVPDEPDLYVPPQQLSRVAEVEYEQAGRTRVRELNPDRTDKQDRPDVHLTSARLVEFLGRPIVVGELINVDVDPTDLTVYAILRNAEGEQIVRYNATERILHSLNPRESTPFLIEFEEVAAGVDLDFDPLEFHPIQLDEEIASFEVYAQGVVTSDGLYRGLQVNRVEIFEDENGEWRIEGELRNDGVREATIPIVLFSFLDENGEVAWVEHAFVDFAVRPQRTQLFDHTLPDLSSLTVADLPAALFSQATNVNEQLVGTPRALVDLPDDFPYPFESMRIDVSTFISATG
ncbi:MAG: hypothetical protein AAF567_13970 [Actinomycetota bacterium]